MLLQTNMLVQLTMVSVVVGSALSCAPTDPGTIPGGPGATTTTTRELCGQRRNSLFIASALSTIRHARTWNEETNSLSSSCATIILVSTCRMLVFLPDFEGILMDKCLCSASLLPH